MPIKTTRFVAEDHFQTEEAQADLIADALASGDTRWLTHAIGIVARSRGMGEVAKQTGISRQALYAAFGPKGNPTISTVMKVLNCLGMSLALKEAA